MMIPNLYFEHGYLTKDPFEKMLCRIPGSYKWRLLLPCNDELEVPIPSIMSHGWPLAIEIVHETLKQNAQAAFWKR